MSTLIPSTVAPGGATPYPNMHACTEPFGALVHDMQQRWTAATALDRPVFKMRGSKRLFDEWLSHLPPQVRAEHNCDACRSFVKRYGSLATIDPVSGVATSLLWGYSPTAALYHDANAALADRVAMEQVDTRFVTDLAQLGVAAAGGFTHFHVPSLMPSLQNKFTTRTAESAMAETRQAQATLRNAVVSYPVELARSAVTVLRTDTLRNAAQFLPVVEWFLGVAQAYADLKVHRRRDSILAAAVATAPAGWPQLRSSMVGTLLDELKVRGGRPLTPSFIRSWSKRVAGENYQRPTAVASSGNIAQAERVIEALSAEQSLERRWATMADVRPIWLPRDLPKTAATGGVFGHLLDKPATVQGVPVTHVTRITWARFKRTVLPNAHVIEVQNQPVMNLMAFTTAVHGDAPPILQWDHANARNPLSTYTYVDGSRPSAWSLQDAWFRATGIVEHPDDRQNSVVITLHGIRDTNNPGSCLFPATLRSEFHAVRNTIENHSNKTPLARPDETLGEQYAGGLGLPGDRHVLRVTTAEGAAYYTVDRWD